MHDKTCNVQCIRTGNAARAGIAEGLSSAPGHRHVVARPAGSHPEGNLHPLARRTPAVHRRAIRNHSKDIGSR